MKGGTVRPYRKDRTEEERYQARRELDKRYRDRLCEDERKRRQNERKARSRMHEHNMMSTASPKTPASSTIHATATTAPPDHDLFQKRVDDAAVAAPTVPVSVTIWSLGDDELLDDATLRELDLVDERRAYGSLTPEMEARSRAVSLPSDIEEALRDFDFT